MKHGVFSLVIVVLVLTAALLVSDRSSMGAPQDIRSTKHNLSTTNLNKATDIHAVSVDDVCVFCHTPHHALTDGPLWNHTLSTRTSYTLYTSSTLLSPAPAGNKPDGDSLLCLSCHDGDRPVGAVQNIGGLTTTIPMAAHPRLTASGQLQGAASFGSDLSGHHPISIELNNCLVNDKQNDATKGCASGKISWRVKMPVDATLLKSTANHYTCGTSTPYKGVQCSSCHDAHTTNAMFLRYGAPGSWSTGYTDSLCCQCHEHCNTGGCP